MESELLIGWRQEKAELKQEVCHLQEELAESRAEREELESRSRALHDRLCQAVSPSLALSLQVEGEQREWGRRLREGREREARQALLIHRLKNKRRIRDENSGSLESALIRLEEEQQADTNTLLREQLSQSEQINQCLRVDLEKLTSDWTKAAEEAEQRENDLGREREARLLSVWRSVVALRRHCHSVKTATD
uniref:Rootletin-like coiled-coil domain-containing protein n=1 Tax=Mola mola TaxID=94237 RepID=A0A3Q4BND7_MOLML